ncbi:DUF3365 domain-containing protein [Corallincola platygyrae]|uniref:DUF3365 domain-containing protein n=1 Tax=Corallincola platygyrae TaxID=1193278 RepID=A0ABW4XPY4_9GAMM
MTTKLIATTAVASTLLLAGCGGEESAGISPQKFTDALHLVMDSDRAVYTKKVVGRLTKQEKVIKASEHFMDDKALPLPAQMFRFGSERVATKTNEFSYSLQSLWPINSQNAPVTEMEKKGLQFIMDNPGQNFYGEEELGGVTYFTAVYPDVAVAPVCASCHNEHKDSPRTDFKVGDVMGGVVIRVPI